MKATKATTTSEIKARDSPASNSTFATLSEISVSFSVWLPNRNLSLFLRGVRFRMVPHRDPPNKKMVPHAEPNTIRKEISASWHPSSRHHTIQGGNWQIHLVYNWQECTCNRGTAIVSDDGSEQREQTNTLKGKSSAAIHLNNYCLNKNLIQPGQSFKDVDPVRGSDINFY